MRPACAGRPRERDALPARRAVAEEAHRVERLAGAAGGDDDVPAGQVLRTVGDQRERRRRDLLGLGQPPGPVSVPVSRPAAGSSTCTPRERRVATLATVAGCSHISVCIAGASRTGQRATSRVAVSRSSARPVAARASRSAVAGATITRSACLPTATCATWSTSSKTSVVTGCPTGPPTSARPTNSSAARVGTTRTAWPVLAQQPQQQDGLVGGDPARDTEDDAHGGQVSPRWPRT